MNLQSILAECYCKLEKVVINNDFSQPLSELDSLVNSEQFQPLLGSLIRFDKDNDRFQCQLTDNAELLIILAHVAGSFYSANLAQQAQLVMQFIVSEHRQADDWYSSLSSDADAIYLSTSQLANELSPECYTSFAAVHFEDYQPNQTTKLLSQVRTFEQVTAETGMYLKQVQYSYEQARQQLATQTNCNYTKHSADLSSIFQAISAIFIGASRFNRPDYLELAQSQLVTQLQDLQTHSTVANATNLYTQLSALMAVTYALRYHWHDALFDSLLSIISRLFSTDSLVKLNSIISLKLSQPFLSISEQETFKALQVAVLLTENCVALADQTQHENLAALYQDAGQLTTEQSLYFVVGEAAPARHLQQELLAEYQANKFFLSLTTEQITKLGFTGLIESSELAIYQVQQGSKELLEIKKEQLISCSFI